MQSSQVHTSHITHRVHDVEAAMVPCASLVRGLVVTIGQNTNMLSLVRHRLQRDGPVRVRSNDLQSTVRPSITLREII